MPGPPVAPIACDPRIRLGKHLPCTSSSGLDSARPRTANQRYLVQTAGGVTQRVLGEMGIHFLILSTTANLLDGGVTPGRQVYMVNLFKRPAEPVPGQAVWFPTRGIPPL